MKDWIRSIGVAVSVLASSSAALAHPHVWITMRSDVVFNDLGLIEGINLEWTFDDNYTQAVLEGLDTDGDGVYSQNELDPLTQEDMASIKDYDYFTVMRVDGAKQQIGTANNYGQIWSDNKLELHFHVPLKSPVDPHNGEFVLKVYDPDFFIAMDYDTDDPVSALGRIPADCKLAVKPVPSDEELDQTRLMLSTKGTEWKPENNEDFGAMFAQPVLIKCK